MQVGACGLLGLGMNHVPGLRAMADENRPAVPRHKSVIYIFLSGGLAQQDSFDLKPSAPDTIRGEFNPIATQTAGIQICEHLPLLAACSDQWAIVRSLTHPHNEHSLGHHVMLTGRTPQPVGFDSNRPTPRDFPSLASMVTRGVPPRNILPPAAVLPEKLIHVTGRTIPGQFAGKMGDSFAPRWIEASQYRDTNYTHGEFPQYGFQRQCGKVTPENYRYEAPRLELAQGNLSREPDSVRDRYGRYTWGQSVLLARRLIEAGVRRVHVNWARDPGDNAVNNPLWDTHSLNADRLQDNLCPQFVPTFAALMDDLSERGLLSETLVGVIGEFGRTPKLNAEGGHDHWGNVFSFAMAGAGIRGGQVIGASDKDGAYPATTPITGGNLTATIFHLLGIDPSGVFHDKENRPHPLTKGEPIAAMLGDQPPLPLHASEGDEGFVPPFDTRLLFDTDFKDDLPLVAVEPPSRTKSWRGWAQPSLDVAKATGYVELKFAVEGPTEQLVIAPGSLALLTQEIRNARGGQYTFKVRASAVAASAEEFDQVVALHVRFRLVLFRFQAIQKDPRAITELASIDFQPVVGETREFVLDRFLASTTPGSNFSIGSGLGVLIAMETTKSLTLPIAQARQLAVHVESVSLNFKLRQRDDSVSFEPQSPFSVDSVRSVSP